MRVRLTRDAYLNDCLCPAGSEVELADHVALAPFMTPLGDKPKAEVAATPAPRAAAEKTVTVHVDQKSHAIDIESCGVEMHFEHAALKLDVD